MDQEGVERQALELATEDWFGVWELLWSVNSGRPDLSPDERASLAAAALRRLRNIGYITFIRVPWPETPTGSKNYDALAPEQVDAELLGEAWRQIPPASDVWFVATPEGEAAYRARTLGDIRGH